MWEPLGPVDDSELSMFSPGYHPKQPIDFSHKLHAGDRQIPCQFCHTAARRSNSAGIPPVEICVGCHKYVNTDAEPIQYIKEKYDKKEPIEWVKVHDLPDFVAPFPHKMHVNAKGPDGELLLGKDRDAVCETCHGNVKEMGTARQVAPLQMGWCIECHNQIKEPATDERPAVTYAPVTCNVCHY